MHTITQSRFSPLLCKQLFKLLFTLLFTLVVSTLSACGWHLAGTQSAQLAEPITALNFVKASKNRDLNIAMEDAMAAHGINTQSSADLTLKITQVRMEKRPYTYSSTGNPVQYQLEMFVEFHYHKPNGEFSVAPTTIVSRRQYDYEASAVIAKSQEEERLQQEMYRDIAKRILARAQK